MTNTERALLVELARVVAGHASAALQDGRHYVAKLRQLSDEVEAEPDLRALLAKYIRHVGAMEGVDYLNQTDWTPEEWAVLQELRD